MKRPRSHILEDNSVAKFKDLLPEKWVLHTYSKDYGIDVQIELFGNTGESTGLRVYGQLKATDKTEDKDTLSLHQEHFEYWAAHSDPILLIRYFDATKSFKWCWMHEVHWRLKPQKNSINVSKYLKKWQHEETPAEIVSLLKLRKETFSSKAILPITISVDYDKKLRGSVALSQIVTNLLPAKSFSVLAMPNHLCHFNINLEKYSLCVGHLGLLGYVISLDKKIELNDIAELAVLLIFLISCRYDRSVLAKAIAEVSSETLFKAVPEELELLLIDNLIYSVGVKKAISLLLKNKSSSDYDPILLFNLLSIGSKVSMKYGQLDEWVEHLKGWAITPPYQEMGGPSAYNYANRLAHNGQWKESIDYYQLASQRDEKYLSRDYYWGELGAAQFESEMYSESADSYQHSYSLNPDSQTAWRLGDALFHSGKYEQSFTMLQNAFSQNQDLGSYQFLVMMVCEDLISNWGIKEQKISIVDDETQKKLMVLKPVSSADELINSLKPFLNKCAIDAQMSFNAGHLSRISNQYQISTYRYLTCALRQRGDADAWANAFLSAMQDNNAELMILIIESGYFYVGEELIQATLNIFSLSGSNKKTSDELEQLLVDLIRSAIQKKDESVTVRFHDEKETKSFTN